MGKRALGATFAAGIVAAAGAAVWYLGLAAEAPPVRAQSAPPAIPVTAGTVVAADVPIYLEGIGTVQAYNTVAIKTRVDGQIVKVDFNEGQEVKQGDPLLQIDPRPYQAALDQAVATQAKDQANLANAQLNLDRDAKIIANHLAVSQQQYDTDKATAAADQALVASDKAQVEAAKLNLSYADIRAPIDGRLGARLVDRGNLVHASDNTPLVTITELKPIFVSFTLPQETLDAVRRHQSEKPLVVDAFSGDRKTLLSTGELTLIDNMIDQATGTIHLKSRFENQDERLWPGEFVNVRVTLTVRRHVPTVPAQTVEEGPDGHFVYVIKPDNTVERRAVEVAATEGGTAVIGKGVSLGERVVVEGQYRLTNGSHVRILPAKAPANS
jgi:membrane fusion protein, multidrug efflux system